MNDKLTRDEFLEKLKTDKNLQMVNKFFHHVTMDFNVILEN